MNAALIRKRLRTLREESDFSQEKLAIEMGFSDRQTLSAIENGDRKISADELVKAAKALGVALDFFVDPFSLYGEASFSWRQKNVPEADLKAFEDKTGQAIGLYRWLRAEQGHALPLFTQNLQLEPSSSYEEAEAAGDELAHRIRQEGVAPALALTQYVQEQLGMLLLHVDAIAGISGAACRLPQVNTILINRRETEGRRHFDIAHELFHLLTWQTMPPRYLDGDDPRSSQDKRVEKLADSFASAVLMPTYALMPHIRARDSREVHDWINAIAKELRVSAIALKYRLKNIGAIKAAEAASIDDARLKFNGDATASHNTLNLPPLFSHAFMSQVGWGIDEGRISVRRIAEMLGLSTDQLASTFAAHGLECPFEL
jgi:XRE family transcriptional regulator, fatty acid utilization regulator